LIEKESSLTELSSNCRNCKKVIEEKMQFCPNCGQKNTKGMVNAIAYITEFFNLVFNIEGKLFITLRDILIPGKLTVKYFRGERKRYFHPLRLFLVLAVILFALAALTSKQDYGNIDLVRQEAIEEKITVDIVSKIDSINQQNYDNVVYNESTYKTVENIKCDILGSYNEEGDTISSPMNIDFDFNGVNIDNLDFVNYSAEELIEKHEITGFWKQFFLKQGIKMMNNMEGFNKHFQGNLVWVILFMMPVLALFLKVFYNNLEKYYVEHLVFLFHTHAFLFLISTIIVLLNYFLNTEFFNVFILIVMPIYILFALRKYYNQSWKVTIAKFLGISFCYSFLAAFFMIAGLVAGFVLF